MDNKIKFDETLRIDPQEKLSTRGKILRYAAAGGRSPASSIMGTLQPVKTLRTEPLEKALCGAKGLGRSYD
ncbi:hypothetical protein EYF80_012530 [Liparis tanakae]|uniref:Uncharacterized protein n=1 Tax=Liparis tanakae TaxID=230148 RepID=A0A4Z2IJ67_9TELE|nr:hypothetical protein EYF80_012530 [Liparis tanakae]